MLLEDGYYRLCRSVQVTTDIEEFDFLYEKGLRLEKQDRLPEASEHFERAVGLYRGDYLVEDLYEDWTMVERERLSNAYMELLGRLAGHAMEAGRHQESIRACYRLLEKDRCHENSHRLLMACYAHLGLHGRALRQYRLCEEALGKEHGLPPSPETRAVHRNIMVGEPIEGAAR